MITWRGRLRQPDFIRQHSDGSGAPRPDLWAAGLLHVRQMPTLPGSQPVTGARWVGIGPAPLRSFNTLRPDSGQVVDIAIDPSGQVDQVIYIAGDGGIWKSTDGGDTWAPTTELMPSLSIGAVVLDPSDPNVVYAGTGNLFSGDRQFSKGIGIYRSIDGGRTWSIVVGSGFAYTGINRVVVPAPGVLVVAASNGVFRSVDGRRHFGANPPGFDDDAPVLGGFATDLTVDTQMPTTVSPPSPGRGSSSPPTPAPPFRSTCLRR